ncbi:MAG TPA: hypothetical protein VLQ80_10145, partial [Candidatus Saccharimonadia bacterium]|nr:hypothetical protein [Candidatus Saccharimonadia bacterium]
MGFPLQWCVTVADPVAPRVPCTEGPGGGGRPSGATPAALYPTPCGGACPALAQVARRQAAGRAGGRGRRQKAFEFPSRVAQCMSCVSALPDVSCLKAS